MPVTLLCITSFHRGIDFSARGEAVGPFDNQEVFDVVSVR